ncbi:MAG: hypothetical protein HY231_06900 [Acidobacteria bacterium]|nr:hypothetical protein [Acidobacteriota bacterium]
MAHSSVNRETRKYTWHAQGQIFSVNSLGNQDCG